MEISTIIHFSEHLLCVCAIIMIASSEGHSHTSIALDTRTHTHTQLNSEQTLVSGLFQSALNYQLLVIKFIHGGSNTPTHTLSSTLRAWCLKELMGCKATIIEEWRANMAAAAGCWAHFAYHFHPPLLTLILSDVNVLSIMWGHLKGNCSNLVKDFCKVGVTDKKNTDTSVSAVVVSSDRPYRNARHSHHDVTHWLAKSHCKTSSLYL